jgi:predicted DNA-binding protein
MSSNFVRRDAFGIILATFDDIPLPTWVGRRENVLPMADKKEKPISVRLAPKALARLDRLAEMLEMNRTGVIQEALKLLEREIENQKLPVGLVLPVAETEHAQNNSHAPEAVPDTK